MSTDAEITRVKDIMITEVITTSPNTTARDAWRIMEKARIRHLPVVVGSKLVGMLSQRELYLYMTTFAIYADGETKEPAKKPEDVVKIRIAEIMSRDPYTILPANTLAEAAQRMAHHRLSALPVVDNMEDKNLIGIVTTQDVLTHMSADFHPERIVEG